jgi:hypothetical protein
MARERRPSPPVGWRDSFGCIGGSAEEARRGERAAAGIEIVADDPATRALYLKDAVDQQVALKGSVGVLSSGQLFAAGVAQW